MEHRVCWLDGAFSKTLLRERDEFSRYKVLKQVLGVDVDPDLAITVEDSVAQLTGLPVGATVNLQVVPTNAAGDAPPSDVIELQAA